MFAPLGDKKKTDLSPWLVTCCDASCIYMCIYVQTNK